MQQRTRYGTTVHSRKVVQDSDAYHSQKAVQDSDAYPRPKDGKIKRVSPLPELRS